MSTALSTRRIFLRPVNEEDTQLLAEWRNTKHYLEFISSRERRNYQTQFLVCLKKNNKSIGVVYTFAHNKNDGYMFLSVFLVDGYRRAGYGIEACALMVCHTFENFPIYKIYCDAFSSNIQSISMMNGAGLQQEGFFVGHRLYNGKRYDVIRFAVHQKDLAFAKVLVKKFNRSKQTD